MSFYDRLDYICSLKGTTVSALCAKCKVASSTATNWKQKQIAPNGNIVIKFAKELNVSTDYLLLGEESPYSIPNDEQELLKYYRLYKDDVGEDIALKEFKSVLPDKRLRCHKDKVSAGTGINLESYISKPIWVYGSNEADKADFAVVVEGESMSPKFHDGDILAVRKIDHAQIETGDIGIFIVNEDKGFVKMLGKDRLISLNPDYKDILFKDNISFRCAGVVLGTVVPL